MSTDQHWSRFAEDFEARNLYVAGRKNIDAIRSSLKGLALSGRVLELGCGNGAYTGLLAETAESVLATDISEPMAEATQARFQDHETILVERQDATALTLADASVDAVVMVNLLHIVPDPDAVLRESRRVLVSGGRVVVASFTTHGMSWWAKRRMQSRYRRTYGKRPKGARHLTVEGTQAMLEAAGFQGCVGRLIGADCKVVFLHARAG